MKFVVNSLDLLKQLQVAQGAIGSNPVLPILEDFLFNVHNNILTITSNDLDTSITTQIEVSSEEDVSVAIPAKILLDTLKAIPQQPLTFIIDSENFGVEITSAYGKYRLAGENGRDFPKPPDFEEVNQITIPKESLLKAIGSTAFATSNDELRMAMTGVFVQMEPENITFAATDAHKLVRYRFFDVKSEAASSFILPKKALNLLKNTLSDDNVTISYNSSNALFTFGKVQMTCRLIDHKYPDYAAVIPNMHTSVMTIARQDFLNSIKRIAIYSNKTTNQVVFNISDKSLTLSAQDLDFSNEAAEQLPCSYQGDPITISFNSKYLIEILGVIPGDEVSLMMTKPNKACVIVPTEQEENEDLLALIMPVMFTPQASV